MSRMHNPPHPGAVLREWLPEGMTVAAAAAALHVARVTLSKILNGSARPLSRCGKPSDAP
jgi:plasmid maintenance system antidote protein VapI